MMDASQYADEMDDHSSLGAPSPATALLSTTTALCGNSLLLSAMTDLSTVCRLGFLCRSFHASFGSRARKVCLLEGAGVPEDRRVEFWSCVLNVNKEKADKMARARLKKPGAYKDVYEACLYGDDEPAITTTAASVDAPAVARGTTVAGRGGGGEEGDADSLAMPLPSPARGPLLPPSGWRALSRHGAEGEISRDVGRTFPRQELFKSRDGPGQNLLANVLKACLKTNPDVGYCQGMNFVAGSLLLACATRDPAVGERCCPRPPPRPSPRRNSSSKSSSSSSSGGDRSSAAAAAAAVAATAFGGDDCSHHPFVAVNPSVTPPAAASSLVSSSLEEGDEFDGSGEDESKMEWRSGPAHLRAEKDVFWVMLALTSRLPGVGSGLGMRELWLPGVPQLKVRVFQFDKLLLRELPRLYNHFKAKQLQLEVLVSQWFLTLFSYSLQPPMLLRVLDLTFTDGWKAMFRFGLARLRSVEDTLCGLELEGVSSFLRNFRDGREPSSPPSPARETIIATSSWYSRGGLLRRGVGAAEGEGEGEGGSAGAGAGAEGVRSADGKGVARKCSSVRLLRETKDVKLTRTMLKGLQQDFAVQLLKEHLQGEGQWLTRYGDAPEPSPGAGAGVIGGDRDGDVGFMGVEAMTRMMLSDAKLLKRLKERLAQMAAPLQADARVFQNKITEASERLEEATRERSSLSSELLGLKEDIDALELRKKLVTDQMHLLLVQFERDSAASHAHSGEDDDEEGTTVSISSSSRSGSARIGAGGGGGGGGVVVRVSPTSWSPAASSPAGGGFVVDYHHDDGLGEASGVDGGGVGGGGGGGASSSVPASLDVVSNVVALGGGGGGVGGGGGNIDEDRCTSSSSSSSSIRSRSSSGGEGDNGELHSDTGLARVQPRADWEDGHPALVPRDDGSAAAACPAARVDFEVGDESGSPVTVTLPRGACGSADPEGNCDINDPSFLQHLPPPPSAKPESIEASALEKAGTATAELSPPPLSRARDSSSAGSNPEQPSGVGEPRQEENQQEQGGSQPRNKPALSPRLSVGSPRSGVRSGLSPPSSPRGGFFMGRDTDEKNGSGGNGGVGRSSEPAEPVIAVGEGSGEEGKGTTWGRLTKWVGSTTTSTTTSGGGGGGAKSSLTVAATAAAGLSYSSWFTSSSDNSRQAGNASVREGGRGRGMGLGAVLSSLSPPRVRRRGRAGKEGKLSLMEELYQDLGQLRRRLEEVQAGIDDKSDMYTTLFHRYTRVMTEAEEAQELKRALSSQMIQLLFEQEQRLEGYLRECITFDGQGSSSLLKGEEEEGEGWDNEGAAAGSAAAAAGGSPLPVEDAERGGSEGDKDGDEDDDGFEKVDAWMARGFGEDGGSGDDGGSNASRGREAEGSLLVPFPACSS